ncbi:MULTISPECIES: hypothetical protein [unclassified Sphingomonas]|uniref:hypothetical protein n=1 Tax=unclassified Sphingomonas TaxID=196159 RepID=UPI000BD4CF58|nr:MAG: hypothetical protein B7Z43_03330 [Sphingomonas sp. 12-62-6]OYX40017.1 MAG: hypothetical protein B7Y98_02915 [Sphingomonas sp. 32-62-10]
MLKSALLLIMASPLLSSGTPAQVNTDGGKEPPIIVYGESLADSARRLNGCIERQCAPDQDIAATLRHAENQFVAGDYLNARRTLLASRSRNKKFSKTYPVEVANLLRANSRVAAHLGEGEAQFLGAVDTVSALKAGLPDDHPRVLGARVELGDAYARFSRFTAAESTYRDVARRARELGLSKIEGHALLRIAAMYTLLAEEDPASYRYSAKRALDTLVSSDNPNLALFADAARVLKARIAFRNGDSSVVDALIARYQTQAPELTPTLLYAPRLDSFQSARTDNLNIDFGFSSALGRLATRNFDDQWIDVGFWVAPDGRVTDAAILRQSGRYSNRNPWAAPILASIEGRRYARIALDPSDPGIFRIERYTFTSRWTGITGTRIRQRSVQPQIEFLDLSPISGKTVTENGPVPAREQRPA